MSNQFIIPVFCSRLRNIYNPLLYPLMWLGLIRLGPVRKAGKLFPLNLSYSGNPVLKFRISILVFFLHLILQFDPSKLIPQPPLMCTL